MRFALINPNWSLNGVFSPGCNEPHLPIEYGYTKSLLEKKKHEAIIIDGHFEKLSIQGIYNRLIRFDPDFVVITTAPSYLSWRDTPPELIIPIETIKVLHNIPATKIAVGPHGSLTPEIILRKLGIDAVIIGECEEIVSLFTDKNPLTWKNIPSICYKNQNEIIVQGSAYESDMNNLTSLLWPAELLSRNHHQHNRFNFPDLSSGAEIEASRGNPMPTSNPFRSRYRKRQLSTVIKELDHLIHCGIEYVYFIDELFLPDTDLLFALAERPIKFGIQTRLELWTRERLNLLGMSGCVSIEAEVKNISEKKYLLPNNQYIVTSKQIIEHIIYTKKRIPFVKAMLIDSKSDNPELVENWKKYLQHFGIWANKPGNEFPYPGTEDYEKLWGEPDDKAWEKAFEYFAKNSIGSNDLLEEQLTHPSELEKRSIIEQRMHITN
ncbi:MAG: B12-binding domain/radical SAM domain-containing protein [Candidatus Margulisbacteria bacterium GWF2_38_17]|nr:MAG: B12-binding domain/radical SAM domain-containing protein [Candidatus Margulisbacteria bacterium GWD2_39_127]OGI02379.1 MAG: B12-binding domain/radical SAM domain-containing protein [Candidatus Margulisbacteria bacterium GWF2_38_17]OGI08512.1 MAG: B12-binding domain/radical SAM domain-containing protein [Candidatus Margulisbacteria bacterium GWE2_39_32]